MSQIQIKDLTFAYEGGTPVFEHFSLSLDTDWKTGLVGRNGRGKTTLLGLLSGELRGRGLILSEREPARFPFACDLSRTAGAMLAARSGAEAWEIEREWSLLEAPEEALSRPLAELSPGERTKAMLAALFLEPERFLLLDEPTNHLDARGREQVGRYLRRKRRGFLLVSHDRDFLDACTDHTVSLNRADCDVVRGSFSVWFREKEAEDRAALEQNQKLKKEIVRLRESARQASEWADRAERSKKGGRDGAPRPDRGYIGHKAAKMMKRAGVLKDRREAAAEEKEGLLKNVEQAPDLKIAPLTFHTDRLAELRKVGLTFSRPLFEGVDLTLREGERVAVTGPNGCGKSSLLSLVCGDRLPTSGQVLISPRLVISRLEQERALSGSLEQFLAERGLEPSRMLTLLRKLDFSRESFDLPLQALSEGQRKKLLLAASLCRPAHLYVWDEPLNYVDLWTRIQIERLILDSRPTLLFVEHDAAFVRHIATRVLDLSPRGA